ncbi:MAG: gliding motility lipoprotein GldH [Muribaculaceae bacterium]|nr:gliding motility lipoprotein GldH [Muribaculaceae bacterium]
MPDALKKYILRASTALAALWMLVACTPEENLYSEFETMSGAEWLYTDSLSFTPAGTTDSIVDGTLLVALRHTRGYRYQNLWLEVAYPVASGDSLVMERDTMSLELADPYGRWLGRGSGASYMREDTLVRKFRLYRGAPVRLRHVMRLDTLPDVEQVGIVFIPD